MYVAEIRDSHSRLPWIRPVITAVMRYALPPQILSDQCPDDPIANCRLHPKIMVICTHLSKRLVARCSSVM